MRVNIFNDRFIRIGRLDYKRIIIIVFLLRLILASIYDLHVFFEKYDRILPDSLFYSARGKYIALLLGGYNNFSHPKDFFLWDSNEKSIFIDVATANKGGFPASFSELNIYGYITGFIYFIFGYHTIWMRIFNVALSILCVLLFFDLARRYFGPVAANIFLLAALFLPTQFFYSITLTRDFLRLFVISFFVWSFYVLGEICLKKIRCYL